VERNCPWLEKEKQTKKNTSKKRPEWAKAKSLKCASRQNGYHMFVKNFKSERILAGLPTPSNGGHAEFFQAAKATWDRMTQEEKAEYSAAAKRENLIRNAVAAGNDDAPAADNAMPLYRGLGVLLLPRMNGLCLTEWWRSICNVRVGSRKPRKLG